MASLQARLAWLSRADSSAAAIIQTIIARGGMLVLNVLTGVIVARVLLPAGRGEQTAIALWPTLFSSFFGLGLPLSLIYNIRRDPEATRKYFSVAIALIAASGILAVVAGIVFVPHVLQKYSATTVREAQAMMVFAIPTLVQYLLGATLEAQGRFNWSNRLRYIPLVLTLFALLALAKIHALTPLSAVLAYNIPTTVLTAATFWTLRELFPLRFEGWRGTARSLMDFGMKSYGSELVNSFTVQIEQGLLVGLLAPSELGLFAISTSISRILGVVQSSFNVVLMPKATELREMDKIVAMTARTARVSSFVTFVAAVAICVVTPIALPFLYGTRFERAIPVAQLLLVDVLLQGVVSVLCQTFIALGRPAISTIFQIGGVAVSVPLLFLLIPRFGLLGAAMAFALASTMRLVIAMASYPILLHQKPPRLVLTRADISFVAARLHLGERRGVTSGPA